MQTTNAKNEANYLTYQGKYKGLLGWIFSTDHKRVGLLYLYSMMTMFSVGVLLGLAMKFELLAPGRTIMDAQSYNATFTVHGVIMIFMIVIPGLPAVFGNIIMPIMIGARDVAFPKLNLLSWWFYVAGVFLVLGALLLGPGTPDTGWTFYAPYSFKTGTNMLPVFFWYSVHCCLARVHPTLAGLFMHLIVLKPVQICFRLFSARLYSDFPLF